MVGTKGQDAWIGASDVETEERFVYLDGVRATQQNTGWSSGQPDGGNEDCVHVHIGGWLDNTANDRECWSREYALCEKPL